jgi:hypothetical protein
MQPYAEVCSILHSYSAFSFQLKLPVFPDIARILMQRSARRRRADFMPFTELLQDFRLQEGGLQVCLALYAGMEYHAIL